MKKSLRKTIMFASSVVLLSLMVFPVAAQIKPVDGGEFSIASGDSPTDVVNFILRIINTFLILVGIAVAVFLIYGGVQYISSTGDDKKAASAKSTILYAIIGLLIVGLSAAIVNFVVGAIR